MVIWGKERKINSLDKTNKATEDNKKKTETNNTEIVISKQHDNMCARRHDTCIHPVIMPNKSTELCKQYVQTEQLNTKGERNRTKSGTNNPPAVPISHPTHYNMDLQVPQGDTLH
eukprot:98000-Ditylum_brightwellii.AAC.1